MSEKSWENNKFVKKYNLKHIDKKFLLGTKQEVDFLEKELDLKEGDTVLDLGCGAGRLSIELTKRGYKVVGIDISEIMLEEAKKRAIKEKVSIEFLQGSIENIDKIIKVKKKFNGAICINESGLGTLGGEGKDLKFLQTVNKMLKSNSKFILTDFNGIRRYKNYKGKFDYINGIINFKVDIPEDDIHINEELRVYIPSEIKMMYKLSDYKNVNVFGCEAGNFAKQKLGIDDIEMMVIAVK